MQEELEKIIVDIIKTEMGLPDNYGMVDGSEIPVIFISSQNIDFGRTENLQISVGVSDITTISNNSNYQVVGEGEQQTVNEVQTTRQLENIQIDIVSRNNDARRRRNEVLQALQSYYSKEQQSNFNFKISRNPISFANTTLAEGGSQLNRFTIIISCFTWYRKSKPTDFYNNFRTRVDDENTIGETNGLIEFELN